MLEKIESEESALLLKEMILENFMAYKYARVQFSPGLNLILGPNGAGKSSLLLALSVALGQAHTERSRKLSDLIRWGEEIARVTLVFDNRPINGRRPVPKIRSDELVITRYIRKDGEYWHQINFKPVTKMEVQEILNAYGIDPDNVLIIMQQYMIEQIVGMNPQEKLLAIERALGLINFREKVNDARQKLQNTVGEEKAVSALLSEAEKTLLKWENEVEKLRKRDSLKLRLEELEIELIWCRKEETLRAIASIEEKIKNIRDRIEKIDQKILSYEEQIRNEEQKIDTILKEVVNEEEITKREEYVEELKRHLSSLIKSRVNRAIGKRIEKLLRKIVESLEGKSLRLKKELEEIEEEIKKKGPRPKEIREEEEIKSEIERVKAELGGLGAVVENAEEIYNSYRKTYEEIKEKAMKIKKEKDEIEKEIKELIERWKNEIEKVVYKIDRNFKERMEKINASGEVRLIDADDIDKAGIQILVSFGGSPLTELNLYTQSGGERSAAVVAFILSLQDLIKSPIRALDEFDVHMDPKTRDTFFKLIEEEAKKHPNRLFLVVTPGLIPKNISKATGIVVQKVSGEAVITIV